MASGNTTFETPRHSTNPPLNPQLDAYIRTTMKHQVPQLTQSLANSYRNLLCLWDTKQRANNLLDTDTEDSSSAARTQLIKQQLGHLEEGLRLSWKYLDMLRYSLGELASGDYLLHPPDDSQLLRLRQHIRLLNETEALVPVGTPISLDPKGVPVSATHDSAKLEGVHKNPAIKAETDALVERIESLESQLGQVETYAFEWVAKTLELEKTVESMQQEKEGLESEVEKLRLENEMLTKERNRACLERNRLRDSLIGTRQT